MQNSGYQYGWQSLSPYLVILQGNTRMGVFLNFLYIYVRCQYLHILIIYFFFPEEGMRQWQDSCFIKNELKSNAFNEQSKTSFSGTRIYVFGLPEIKNIPFRIVEIDNPWIGRIIRINHNNSHNL